MDGILDGRSSSRVRLLGPGQGPGPRVHPYRPSRVRVSLSLSSSLLLRKSVHCTSLLLFRLFLCAAVTVNMPTWRPLASSSPAAKAKLEILLDHNDTDLFFLYPAACPASSSSSPLPSAADTVIEGLVILTLPAPRRVKGVEVILVRLAQGSHASVSLRLTTCRVARTSRRPAHKSSSTRSASTRLSCTGETSRSTSLKPFCQRAATSERPGQPRIALCKRANG